MAQTLVYGNKKKIIAFLFGIGFWLFFFGLPFFALLDRFFVSSFSTSLDSILKILSDEWYRSVIFFTFQQALLSAFFTLVIGIPISFIFAKFSLGGFEKIYFIFLLPFIMPTILVVLSIIQFWGHQGMLNQFLKTIFFLQNSPLKIIYSLKGILIAHIFFNLPVVLQVVGKAKQRISTKYSEAALVLDCSKWKYFWKVDLPLLTAPISACFIFIFLLCMNSFAVIWVLGGGRNFIIESLIYELAKIHLDYQSVLVFTLFQILLSLFFVKFFHHFQLHSILQEPIKKKSFRIFFKKHPLQGLGVIGILFLALIFVLGPLSALVLDSFQTSSGFSIIWWKKFFQSYKIITIFWKSFQIAFASSCISFGLLLLIVPFFLSYPKYRKNLEILFLIPLSTSFIALGLGWFLFYEKFLSIINFPLVLYVICIHAVIFFAYWIKIFLPLIETIPKSWLIIKSLYGYSWLSFSQKVLFAWLKKPFLQNFSLVMALSFGELNILLMLSDNNLETFTTSIFSAISSYRFSYASVIGITFLAYFFFQNFLLELITKKKNDL